LLAKVSLNAAQLSAIKPFTDKYSLVLTYRSLVEISQSIRLQLQKGSQKIIIDIDEAKQIIQDLGRLIGSADFSKKTGSDLGIRRLNGIMLAEDRKRLSTKRMEIHMSDSKRKEIHRHLIRHLSTKPKTLSKLLEGVSYVPNHLPYIRKMIEGRENVTKKRIGKRLYYSLK